VVVHLIVNPRQAKRKRGKIVDLGGVERGDRNVTFGVLCTICDGLTCDIAAVTKGIPHLESSDQNVTRKEGGLKLNLPFHILHLEQIQMPGSFSFTLGSRGHRLWDRLHAKQS
jgi:hypothetical protein